MNAAAPKAVLFDWDGTLLDSAEATYRCYRELFAAHAIAFDRESFERTYCPDWYRTYEAVGLDRERWTEADAHWTSLYKSQPPALIAGIEAPLHRLHARGLRLGIVTAGERKRVEADLERVGLSRVFAALVCAGDIPERKPHPEPLRLALRRLEVRAADAAYVGDSPEDIRMARDASVFAVAIPGGFPNREALLAAQPDFVADDLAQALARLGLA